MEGNIGGEQEEYSPFAARKMRFSGAAVDEKDCDVRDKMRNVEVGERGDNSPWRE